MNSRNVSTLIFSPRVGIIICSINEQSWLLLRRIAILIIQSILRIENWKFLPTFGKFLLKLGLIVVAISEYLILHIQQISFCKLLISFTLRSVSAILLISLVHVNTFVEIGVIHVAFCRVLTLFYTLWRLDSWEKGLYGPWKVLTLLIQHNRRSHQIFRIALHRKLMLRHCWQSLHW